LAFILSAAAIRSSFWVDETATYWVVKNGIREVVARSWEWSGQSALYYLTAWIGRHFAPYLGLELALRLPSLAAMAIAAFLLYRLGRYLMGAKAGMIAALAFLAIPQVSFAAIDARPYALGLALVIASMLCFLKWLDTGRPIFAALYVVSTALVVYDHYLFALSLTAQLAYGWRRGRWLAALWAAIGALCLPLAGQFLYFYHTRQAHNVGALPDANAFFMAIAPPVLVGTVLLSIMASKGAAAEAHHGIPWRLLFVWLMAPPAILSLVSWFTDTRLFLDRYYLSAAPAAALLAAYAVARCSAFRLASAVLAISLAIGTWKAGPLHGGEDWRGAMQAVNAEARPEDAVLIDCGFVEGTPAEIQGARLRDVLYAPQSMYPIRNFIRLPFHFDERSVPEDLARYGRVFLITIQTTPGGQDTGMQYECWLKRKLPGYASQGMGNFGGVSAIRFDRDPAPGSAR
jgi:mannosyltransferase